MLRVEWRRGRGGEGASSVQRRTRHHATTASACQVRTASTSTFSINKHVDQLVGTLPRTGDVCVNEKVLLSVLFCDTILGVSIDGKASNAMKITFASVNSKL